jgi:hypothetical protein
VRASGMAAGCLFRRPVLSVCVGSARSLHGRSRKQNGLYAAGSLNLSVMNNFGQWKHVTKESPAGVLAKRVRRPAARGRQGARPAALNSQQAEDKAGHTLE